MQNSTINWDDIRLFLALARHGSARSAADTLGVSHTTISRRAEQLEANLGTRLFDRDVSGYRLTGEGETMLGSARKAEEALLAAERQLQGRDSLLSGEIRLTTSDILAGNLLMPDLAEFAARYPQIDLNVMISYDLFDLSRREADIALRFMVLDRSPPDELVGRKLVTISSCYYASPDYLAQHDPRDRNSGARWIGWNDEQRFPDWVTASPFPDIPAFGKFDNPVLQAAATRHGMGIAVMPCFVGDTTDGVIRIPGCEPYASYDVWLLSHPDLRDAARLRTFRKFIAGSFDKKRALLTGREPRAWRGPATTR